jgi:PKD repeat protein
MKKICLIPKRHALAVLTAGVVVGGMLATTSRADYYKWPASIPVENEATNAARGVQAAPILNAPVVTPTNVTVSWYGMQGWSTVVASTNGAGGPYFPVTGVKATAHNWSSKLTNAFGPTALFQVAQTNFYSGSGECAGCHGDTYENYANTAHAGALASLQNIGMGNNPDCLQCHNVGMNQATGFTDSTATPHLANVGCESCHGPAGWHKNSDHNIHPVVSIDPKICGSCHQDSHHPTYEEYAESGHAGAALETRFGCAACHSATMRMTMLNEYNDMLAGRPHALDLPTGTTASAWTATCATCHDPHNTRTSPLFAYQAVPGVGTNMVPVAPKLTQLRNPLWSSNFYTLPTVTDVRTVKTTNYNGVVTTTTVNMNTVFDSLYDSNVQICGQCHNHRGARWDTQVYGLVTNTIVGSLTTNVVYVDLYTTNTVTQVFTNELGVPYLTNSYTYSYVSGRTNTTVVVTPTNNVIDVGIVTSFFTATNGGVVYTGTNSSGYGRPPHHSPQYNMLVGIVQPDYLNTLDGRNVYNGTTNNGKGIYAAHSGIAPRSIYNTNQCVTCHMPSYSVNSTTKVTGHTFEMNEKGCALAGCHTSGTPGIEEHMTKTTNSLAQLAVLLNQWALKDAPDILRTNYAQLAWEYTSPGALGTKSTNAGVKYVVGPNATMTNSTSPTYNPLNNNLQLLIPESIRQARFNAYMVLHDGSLGVHNPRFTTALLNDAENKVLDQITVAKFKANVVNAYTNAPVIFTNLNASATASCTWDFGNGISTSSAAAVTNYYTTPGIYTVSLTVTDTNGATSTMTRTNYIGIWNKPVPSFTYTPGSLTAPATVNFTNTSENAGYYAWVYMFGTTGSPFSNDENPPAFTYTNAGTYKVRLTAYNLVGSVAVTNTITVTAP